MKSLVHQAMDESLPATSSRLGGKSRKLPQIHSKQTQPRIPSDQSTSEIWMKYLWCLTCLSQGLLTRKVKCPSRWKLLATRASTNVMFKRRTKPKEKPLNEIVGKVDKKRKKEGKWKRNIEKDVKGTAADAGCITENRLRNMTECMILKMLLQCMHDPKTPRDAMNHYHDKMDQRHSRSRHLLHHFFHFHFWSIFDDALLQGDRFHLHQITQHPLVTNTSPTHHQERYPRPPPPTFDLMCFLSVLLILLSSEL